MDGENWPPLRDSKVEVSSVSPSSEWIEESWVLSGLYTKLKIKKIKISKKKKTVKLKKPVIDLRYAVDTRHFSEFIIWLEVGSSFILGWF